MSDSEKPFAAEIAKQGRAVCKKCKQKCNQKELRIAKLQANPFGEGKMKAWHHIDCLFEVFQKQRATTKRIEDPEEDIDGWDALSEEHKKIILDKLDESNKFFENKFGIKITPKKTKTPEKTEKPEETVASTTPKNSKTVLKDNKFKEFRKIVAEITNVSAYLDKTEIVKNLFKKGTDGDGFKGDVVLWCRLLLPGFVKRIYNLQSKQIIKLFSTIFKTDQDAMLEHLEQGDVSETIQEFFEKSEKLTPAKKSTLTLQEVDEWLEELSKLTKEDEQSHHLKKIAKKCTGNDLKTIIRLIKHDLRMNAGAKHILEGVHPDAYAAYQSSRDIASVINRCLGNGTDSKATIQLMTPVLPMLAEACKSVEQAMKKCPNGMYSEIKYDGERVQVHKQGTNFKYFSRSLKPVMNHKIAHFKDFIPQAFPHAKDLILDSEILMIDTQTGKPLPFGTLGVHKKSEFKDASVCLFVFDCIYYNGDILTHKPLKYRKNILKENMTEIPNHIMFSEMQEIHDPSDLSQMIAKVLKLGLEGLVLKDIKSIYEPGKRHWLKVKKDYLFDGAMADSADLIVLGAWYGTGKKGGMMSVFLMGCYCKTSKKFCTVTKVHTGHDDKTLERLQTELDMIKISGDVNKVPDWLRCTKTMVPDFVARDPRKQPVWEITGAEFTQQHDVHTANGISIRFPRVTKIREDKTWETATTVEELKVLFKTSKENTDVSLLMKGIKKEMVEEDLTPSSSKKIKRNSAVLEESVKKENSDVLKKVKKEKVEEEDDDNNLIPSSSKKIKRENSLTNNNIKNFVKKMEVDDEVRVKIENPLPDYFASVKIGVGEGVRTDLVRYFIAYGGIVCKNTDYSDISYFVHKNKRSTNIERYFSPSVKHVTEDWLRQCIISERICDYKKFVVKLEPH